MQVANARHGANIRPSVIVRVLALATLVVGCEDASRPVAPTTTTTPQLTMGTGTVSTLLGRATFPGPFNVLREGANRFRVHVTSKGNMDVVVQSITFAPGAQSGWHTHPGPVFIQVVSGTITFYDSDDPSCSPIVRTAGQGFLDTGEHAHIARNETGLDAQNVVTYFAPPGAVVRIDAPSPGNCPF